VAVGSGASSLVRTQLSQQAATAARGSFPAPIASRSGGADVSPSLSAQYPSASGTWQQSQPTANGGFVGEFGGARGSRGGFDGRYHSREEAPLRYGSEARRGGWSEGDRDRDRERDQEHGRRLRGWGHEHELEQRERERGGVHHERSRSPPRGSGRRGEARTARAPERIGIKTTHDSFVEQRAGGNISGKPPPQLPPGWPPGYNSMPAHLVVSHNAAAPDSVNGGGSYDSGGASVVGAASSSGGGGNLATELGNLLSGHAAGTSAPRKGPVSLQR